MENNDKNSFPQHAIHKVLAHSYSLHFILFLVGVVLELVFNFKFFNDPISMSVGFFFLVFGTFLVFWAQKTSRKLNKNNVSKETFCRGPYCYTRTPTNFGLFFLVLGFGLIINAFFVVLSAFVSFFLSKFVFLNKQEKMLAIKYGTPYLEYKEKVKF